MCGPGYGIWKRYMGLSGRVLAQEWTCLSAEAQRCTDFKISHLAPSNSHPASCYSVNFPGCSREQGKPSFCPLNPYPHPEISWGAVITLTSSPWL